MQTIIHLVRHGQAENPQKIVYGRMPGFHLSVFGKKQARKVGKHFSMTKIGTIYTSPLERAFETANIISEYQKGVKIKHVYDLIEADYSKWQTWKMEDLFKADSYMAFLNDPKTNQTPENLNTIANRMAKFINQICKFHKGSAVICVSHEYPIIVAKLTFEGNSLTGTKTHHVSTGSITTLVLDENCTMAESSYTELK